MAPASEALLHAPDTDQRIAAAVVLSNGLDFIAANERDVLETALIDALSDPNIHVREFVAGTLRSLNTPTGQRALARSIEGPNTTDMLWGLVTGTKRPSDAPAPTESSFPPATVAAVKALDPEFLVTLTQMSDGGVRRLINAIDASRNADTTPVLMWLLAHGDMRSYGGLIVNHLLGPSHIERIDVDELLRLLAAANPDHRAMIVDMLGKLLQVGNRQMSSAVRDRATAALIDG